MMKSNIHSSRRNVFTALRNAQLAIYQEIVSVVLLATNSTSKKFHILKKNYNLKLGGAIFANHAKFQVARTATKAKTYA
jgi:hypothetical protein